MDSSAGKQGRDGFGGGSRGEEHSDAGEPAATLAGLTVRAIGTDDPSWERFVSSRPDGRIYHHPAWSDVLREAYGYRVTALAAQAPSGAVTGVLPLGEKRGVLTGHRFSSLPHTPVCGPLAGDDETIRVLLSAARDR